jgi:hypothetical protein
VSAIFGDVHPNENIYYKNPNIQGSAEQAIHYYMSHSVYQKAVLQVQLIDIYLENVRDLTSVYLKRDQPQGQSFIDSYLS